MTCALSSKYNAIMETESPTRPLSAAESAVFEALGRAILVMPRALELDLMRSHRMSMSEFMTLASIAESPERRLRMSDLAVENYLSLSGMTRIVTRLENEGWVERVRCAADARGADAVLTDAGWDQYQRALPTHIASLRHHIFDPLAGTDLDAFAHALESLAPSMQGGYTKADLPQHSGDLCIGTDSG
jgi:DNA-binding MarR family transcriptional regulator